MVAQPEHQDDQINIHLNKINVWEPPYLIHKLFLETAPG